VALTSIYTDDLRNIKRKKKKIFSLYKNGRSPKRESDRKPAVVNRPCKQFYEIHEHLDSNLSIQEISRHTHLSKSVLYKIFHEHLGCTINDYITSQRLKKACSLLQKADMSLEEIAASTGFSNADYFGRVFKKKKGCTPSKYRKQHMDSTQ